MLEEKLAPQVRVMQLILFGMVSVPLVFAGVVTLLASQGEAPDWMGPPEGVAAEGAAAAEQEAAEGGGLAVGDPLETTALVVGLVTLFAQQVVGRLVTEQGVRSAIKKAGENGKSGPRIAEQLRDDPEPLGGAYLVGLMVPGAMNEGAAFLALIATMVGGSPLCLGMAMLLILSNAMKFPTRARVAAWADARARQLEEEASLA